MGHGQPEGAAPTAGSFSRMGGFVADRVPENGFHGGSLSKTGLRRGVDAGLTTSTMLGSRDPLRRRPAGPTKPRGPGASQSAA